MNKMIWINEEEGAWVNSQPRGYIRGLIKDDMTKVGNNLVEEGDKESDAPPSRTTKSPQVADNVCRKCGSLLPYKGAKCKYC